jgi:hypothetical protein
MPHCDFLRFHEIISAGIYRSSITLNFVKQTTNEGGRTYFFRIPRAALRFFDDDAPDIASAQKWLEFFDDQVRFLRAIFHFLITHTHNTQYEQQFI